MRNRLRALAALVAIAATPANAAILAVVGLGSHRSCADWLYDQYSPEPNHETKLRAHDEQTYVEGFLTGEAVADGRGFTLEDLAVGDAAIDKYCRLHPHDNLAKAAIHAWNALAKSLK